MFALQNPVVAMCAGQERIPLLRPARQALARPPPQRRTRRRRVSADRDSAREDSKLQAPDTPPAKGAAPSEEPATSSATATAAEPEAAEGRMTAEEIQRQMGQLRAAQAETKKDGLVEGVLEEVGLIKWPTPQSALLNTLLVIAIVAGTSALLFGVNAALSELSRLAYSRS